MKFEIPTKNDIMIFLTNAELNKEEREFLTKRNLSDFVDNLIYADMNFMQSYKVGSIFFGIEGNFIGALFGAIPVFDGVVEWYSYTDTRTSKYHFAKGMLNYFDYLMSIPNLVRLQSTVLVNNKRAYNLHKKLGFKEEGMMRKYDGKNDYYMMAVVK